MSAANAEIAPIAKGWSELTALIDTLGPSDLELKGSGRWAVKDHLFHIAAWELSLLALLDGEDLRSAMGVPGAAEDIDSLNEAVWLAHRDETAEQARDFSRASHEKLTRRLEAMSDADLRRSYNHYQPNDPRDPGDDRPVVEWVAGDTYEHYAEHRSYIDQIVKESRAAR
jgi:uncharacterized damage-inducible protein DinB